MKRAVHVVNTSGHVLANGSVNVLDGGRFVAQCQFAPMIPGDDQLFELGEDTQKVSLFVFLRCLRLL